MRKCHCSLVSVFICSPSRPCLCDSVSAVTIGSCGTLVPVDGPRIEKGFSVEGPTNPISIAGRAGAGSRCSHNLTH